ncbi:hypothetical protein NHH03_02055 [Stieleria sp. TO1_6]|uniref:hypothetical protein n=1 Tax=Stieleria tagensis TaxID=2956795 RepID=UPI00209BA917|nr:hypothetical protein [Stieleria tagensis]MCO8120505.1 hypothetical protein [Stieleria tagensis]
MPAQKFCTDRRSFLAAAVAAASAGMVSAPSLSAADVVPVADGLMRVRIEIDVKGNVKVSDNALASRKAQQTFPVTSKAVLDYEERSLRPGNADIKSETVAAERYYHTASSTGVLNKSEIAQSLRPDMRHALVRRESLPETIYSPDNFFTHSELSLLRSPVSSVSVNRLLPGAPVTAGDRYEIASDVLCSVLNLSSVDSGKVDSHVVEVTDDAVRFKLEGDLEGSVDGVGTRLRLIGKMTFDRRINTCTWLALGVHETREIGKAEPGFDVSATIRMVRQPLASPVAMPAKPHAVAFGNPIPPEHLYVELQSRQHRVGTMMDRRWRMIQETPAAAVMRMIENDQSIAQCNLRPLVTLPEGKQWTLEAFEADVRQTLGDQLGQLIEGDQGVSAQGLRVLRIVADGETQGIPIRWIMMHFSDDAGRRVQATFTMSGDKVETFAGNDAQFGDSLRFLEREDLPAEPSPQSEPLAGQVESSLQIANRPSDEPDSVALPGDPPRVSDLN